MLITAKINLLVILSLNCKQLVNGFKLTNCP